jgi:hypothetical protein
VKSSPADGHNVALICHPLPSHGEVEVTYWPTAAEARQASTELAPCGPRCIGVHTVVNLGICCDSCPPNAGITDGAIKRARRRLHPQLI